MSTQRIKLLKPLCGRDTGDVIEAKVASIRALELRSGVDYQPIGTHPGPMECDLQLYADVATSSKAAAVAGSDLETAQKRAADLRTAQATADEDRRPALAKSIAEADRNVALMGERADAAGKNAAAAQAALDASLKPAATPVAP